MVLGCLEVDYIKDDAAGIESKDSFSSSQFEHGKETSIKLSNLSNFLWRALKQVVFISDFSINIVMACYE